MFRMNAPNCNILALGLLLAASPVHAQQRDPSIAPQCTRSSASFCRQTLHDKFLSYAVGTFGPRALFVPLFPASYLMAFPPDRYPRDWREGLPALGRNYADQFAAQTSFQTARFATSAILHEDLLYHRSASKSALVRAGHALVYSFVDKSDSGRVEPPHVAGCRRADKMGPDNLGVPAHFNDVSHADRSMAIPFWCTGWPQRGRRILAGDSPTREQVTPKNHPPAPGIVDTLG